MTLSPDAGTDVTDSGNDEPTVTEGETTDDAARISPATSADEEAGTKEGAEKVEC